MSGLVCSIDIGLRNLSFCIMSSEDRTNFASYKIHLWDVYNTLDSDDYKCESLMKNGKICDKKCNFKYKNNNGFVYCCKTHFPKDMLPLKKENNFKKKNVKDYLLQDIAKIVLSKIQNIYDTHIDIFKQLSHIIIELQPKVNQCMKFTSHIIYGKLTELMIDTKCTIRFVRASQKLKAYTGPIIQCKLKGAYAKRKWLSVQYCKWFLENKFNDESKLQWLTHFNSKTIQPDMADTFLMTINCIHGIPKKQFKHKNGNEIK